MSKTYIYNKLVRDRAPEMVERSNGTFEGRHLDDAQFRAQVRTKLVEELDEILAVPSDDPTELAEEIGDVLELLEEYGKLHGLSREQLVTAQNVKRERRGGFATRLYIESVTAPEGSIVDVYCRQQPDKYPVKDE